MTLSERNTFFKTSIIFCSIVTLLIIASSFITIPVYPVMEDNARRPENIFQFITGRFMESSLYAVHISLTAAVLFSLIGIVLIYSFFQRTSAPEILYVSIFTVSFSFEIIRLIMPINMVYLIPSYYLLYIWRFLLFCRYFSLFSLLAAGLYSAGFEMERTRNMIFVITIASLVITIGIPVDTQAWDTSLNLTKGFNNMFIMIEAAVFIATVLSFFIAVRIRGSAEYAYIGIGAFFALAGRQILLASDNFAGPVAGTLMLAFGTWFICSKLHKIHLWL